MAALMLSENRKPVRFANYAGSVDEYVLGHIVGPRDDGHEHMTIVSIEYDESANTSRVGFAFTVVSDAEALAKRHSVGQHPAFGI